MTCFDQQNLLEVILNEFWSLDLKRPHSFHSCPFAALTLLGEDARASLLEDERPQVEREKPSTKCQPRESGHSGLSSAPWHHRVTAAT